MDIESLLAPRTSRLESNAIREILKVVSQPGMVSLAGGIPAPESFPIEIMRELTQRATYDELLTEEPSVAWRLWRGTENLSSHEA